MRPLVTSLALGVLCVTAACTRSTEEPVKAPAAYETRTSEGVVSFAVTPRRADGRIILDVQADTHGGDLSEINLKDAVVLRADGRTYRPVESTSLAGHHAKGSVTFEVPDTIERLSIAIASVRGMGELTFEWP